MINLEVGKRYIVTKESNDGTFLVGDHIWLGANDSICNLEASGWIDADAVKEATIGVEVEIDTQWIKDRKSKLIKELDELNKI